MKNEQWPQLLVLVRHAESTGNIMTADERARSGLGTNDYPLTPHGHQQAEITGKYLNTTYGKFDHYITSYYRRTKQTLKIMYPHARPFEDSRLVEGQRGIWHTMTDEQIGKEFPREKSRRKLEGLYHYRPFGGENWGDIELRIYSFLETLRHDYAGKKVLVSVHGNWLILLDRIMHQRSIKDAMCRYKKKQHAQNASVTVFERKIVKGNYRLVAQQSNFVPWQGKLIKPEEKLALA